MKKVLFILALVIVLPFGTKGQSVSDTIFEDYFLPDYIDIDNCGLTLFSTGELDMRYGMTRGHSFFSLTGAISGTLDRAQPCYTDTLLTLKGVAIGVNHLFSTYDIFYSNLSHIVWETEGLSPAYFNQWIEHYDSIPKGKLKIMNGTLDREIVDIDIDSNFIFSNVNGSGYLEFYFDTPINVNGLFYIVEDVTNTSTRLLHVVGTKECYFDYPSLVRTSSDISSDAWVQWSEHPSSAAGYEFLPIESGESPAAPNTCQMYFFPIFAETDSTLGDGLNFDTNDSTDMSLYNATVDRYSNVYPNPAKDIVTVQSSFKVKEIEIHNALGQVVLRKEGSQNIETIDVSNLQSGAYIVRIKTQRGFANKKILIE
ncbi:MAG: T9SS type A sorting domain-containing protein [Bacteroidales bacterium]|nr:T9SS type A sorting domain-containing protein [Bacteroidales bacterium]MEE1143324.1 T9SS type A sorting domain-containing protein [Bacteroidales bacterium]